MSLVWRYGKERWCCPAADLARMFVVIVLCFPNTTATQRLHAAPARGHIDTSRADASGETGQVSGSATYHADTSSALHLANGVKSRSKHHGRFVKDLSDDVDIIVLGRASEHLSQASVAPPMPLGSGNSTHTHAVGDGEPSVDNVLCEYYSSWSKWRPCNRKCEQSRARRCLKPDHCGQTRLKEIRTCQRKRGTCSSFSYRTVGFRRRNRLIERVLYDVLYSDWSDWGPCTRSCRQRRRRRCSVRDVCHNSFIQEMRRCTVPGSRCQRRYSLKPSDSDRLDHTEQPASHTQSSHKGQTQVGITAKRDKQTKDSKDRKSRTKSASLDSVQEACGLRPPSGSYRVVGGQEAQRLSWPWQVAILSRWEEQYCAGTLVAPQWVLTAAHCIRKKNRKRRLVVRTGEHDLQVFEGSEDDIRPDKDFPYPHFDYATITNDIGLVHLRQPVKNRSHVRYACLPDENFEPDSGALCYILGWGKRRNTHLFGSDTLHEAQVPLVEHKRCQKVFDYDINTTQVCAGYRKGGIDSCAGDSGGPLLCPRTTGSVTRWYLMGITSYGEGCGRKGKYGIYTRVVSYLHWIRDTIDTF